MARHVKPVTAHGEDDLNRVTATVGAWGSFLSWLHGCQGEWEIWSFGSSFGSSWWYRYEFLPSFISGVSGETRVWKTARAAHPIAADCRYARLIYMFVRPEQE